MKLAIIGGGGIRVPLLVNGLVRRGLPITDIALFDIDRARLEVITGLTALRSPRARLTTHDTAISCVDGADFVITSIRVGGLAAREHDETVALAHGIAGQETVGPAGFAMAVRTIPAMARYAEAIAKRAPGAWVINFTNPVGIITQAMHRAADLRVIGICDTPTELFAEIAHALRLPPGECAFDYVGLNHLGWVREVTHHGSPVLDELWTDRERLGRVYRHSLFPVEYLETLRLLPTEYVYYYDFPARAEANIRAAGRGRGAVVADLTRRFFAELAAAPADPVAVYERYLAERSASYMQIESGSAAPQPPSPWADLTGYDRIAFDVLHAIVHDSHAVIPLNVLNRGNVSDLAPSDVVEVPCTVGAAGPRPLPVGALPPQVRDLVIRVKEYERHTIDAAGSRREDALVGALASNPLVSSPALAATMLRELTLA